MGPQRYGRHLEAIRNVLSRVFENAGPTILTPSDFVKVRYVDCYDGNARIYHNGHEWVVDVRAEGNVYNTIILGPYWADAVRKATTLLMNYILPELLLDEEMEIMAETDLGELVESNGDTT